MSDMNGVFTHSPTMTALRFKTGFQSSRRMFRQLRGQSIPACGRTRCPVGPLRVSVSVYDRRTVRMVDVAVVSEARYALDSSSACT